MEIPEDLGHRIVEAARLAVMLHLRQDLLLEMNPGGTGRKTGRVGLRVGGVDLDGGAAMDGGDYTPPPAPSIGVGALAEDITSAAQGGTSAARGGASAAGREAA